MKRVSARRSERLARIGARGPLQAEARRQPCCNCDAMPTDPAHLERVGKGYGDWKRIGGRWLGRVAPLCRRCHDVLDGNAIAEPYVRRALLRVATAAAVALGERWAHDVGVDPGAEQHPYEQWRDADEPHPADIV